MTLAQIEDALYDWVYGVVGVEVRFSHQDLARPTTSYVLVNIISSIPIGHEDTYSVLQPDDSVDVEYSGLNNLFISINSYYDGAWDRIKSLKKSLGRVLIIGDLYAEGLAFTVASAVRRLPESIDRQWEERAMFDVSFNLRDSSTENIETIKKVQITNELDGTTTIVE